MAVLDLESAADEMATLVAGVDAAQLAVATPCAGTPVAGLLDHVLGLSGAFAVAARKETGPASGPPPAPSVEHLDPDWRAAIPRQLAELAEAWKDPTAWTGMTRAGGLDMPGEVAGTVALDELVLHGWDLAMATGRPFHVDAALLTAVEGFVRAVPPEGPQRDGLFGPVVPVPADAPMLDRVLGLSGRDPAWSPAG